MKTNTTKLRRALNTFAKTGKITLTASALMALALSAAPADAKSITDTLANGDTVTIEQNTTVTAPVTIPANLTIIGNAPSTTLSGTSSGVILQNFENNINLTLKNLTISNGSGYEDDQQITWGGAIIGDTNKLTINGANVVFENNIASDNGGAIMAGNVSLNGDHTFRNNEAGQYGGAILAGYRVYIDGNNLFENNKAGYHGGAISSLFLDEVILSGTNTFKNNKVLKVSSGSVGGGAISAGSIILKGDDSVAIFEGNTLAGAPNDIATGYYGTEGSVKIQDAGTYTFGGGIVSAGLDISDANVTFKNGSKTDISGAVTLVGANVTIEGADGAFKTGSMTADTGSKLNLVYTGNTGGTLISGDLSGLPASIINIQYSGLDSGSAAVESMGANGLTISVIDNAGTFNLIQNGTHTQSSSTLTGLGTVNSGDQIIVTDNAVLGAGDYLTVPESLTIRSNALGTDRTLTANGTTPIFSTDGTSALTLENITISGAKNTNVAGGWISGSAITGGNWDITGGKFADNKVETPDGKGNFQQRGGAISGSNINLNGVDFANNAVLGGDITEKTTNPHSQAWGGAVAGSQITISGESAFANNTAKSGDVAAHEENTGVHDATWGGAVATNGDGSNITIGKDDVKDTISFTGNIADATATSKLTGSSQGGAFGGAVGSENGNIAVKAKAGDTILFENNRAESKNSRAFGGAIATGRNSGSKLGTISIEAEEDDSVVFSGNTAVSEAGNLHAMGGAVYGRNNINIDNAVFDGNTVSLENSNKAGAKGGAVYLHNANATLNIENSTFKNNAALVDGDAPSAGNEAQGGALAADGKIVLSGENKFENNKAENTVGEAQGGAIYGEDVAFVGDESNATFTGNTANGVNNDIYAENSVSITGKGVYSFGGGIVTPGQLSIANANVTFGRQSITDLGSMAVNGADVTFQDGAKLTVNGGTVDNATLNLEGCVDFSGKLTMTNTTANFNAGPTVNGFTTLNADQFSGTVNVDLNVFTVGAMDNTTNTLTLIDGAKAENVNITNNKLMTLTDDTAKTAVTINQDKDGKFGSAPVQNSELVGIDFGKDQTSMTVKDFSLIVEGVDSEINLQDFADWLGEQTGLKTAVGAGYVNVRLNDPFKIMKSDSFIWDFSAYDASAALQFATVNIMDNAVPEPSTWALLVLGGLGILGMSRRNRKK